MSNIDNILSKENVLNMLVRKSIDTYEKLINEDLDDGDAYSQNYYIRISCITEFEKATNCGELLCYLYESIIKENLSFFSFNFLMRLVKMNIESKRDVEKLIDTVYNMLLVIQINLLSDIEMRAYLKIFGDLCVLRYMFNYHCYYSYPCCFDLCWKIDSDVDSDDCVVYCSHNHCNDEKESTPK